MAKYYLEVLSTRSVCCMTCKRESLITDKRLVKWGTYKEIQKERRKYKDNFTQIVKVKE